MPNRYDVIVLGVGSMGSAACWHLAQRGLRVLGLEQFDIPNTRASHHGYSRMIRLAYFEHPDYVTLLKRAYELWQQLEEESDEKLLHMVGGLYLGRPDSELVTGSLRAARDYDLPHEMIERDELRRRFPQFHVPEDTIAFYETKAGFIVPEKAVAAHALLALRRGAHLRGGCKVTGWSAQGANVTVTTTDATYAADHLIIAGGAWSGQLLRDLQAPLTVTRQAMGWFWPKKPKHFAYGVLPCWALDLAPREQFRGLHYGFPMMTDNPGFKVALHWPAEPCDPDTFDRNPHPQDEANIRAALTRYLPDADGPLLNIRICLYTNTPDGHFIIDHHPQHPNVTLACGFSGHGFKFASAVGEALADLAITGVTPLPIDFLRLNRFAST